MERCRGNAATPKSKKFDFVPFPLYNFLALQCAQGGCNQYAQKRNCKLYYFHDNSIHNHLCDIKFIALWGRSVISDAVSIFQAKF